MARVNEGSHSFARQQHVYPQVECSVPAFNRQLQSVAALSLVLISRTTEGRRLSWPGWLGEILCSVFLVGCFILVLVFV